jgi:hypothetical protein
MPSFPEGAIFEEPEVLYQDDESPAEDPIAFSLEEFGLSEVTAMGIGTNSEDSPTPGDTNDDYEG